MSQELIKSYEKDFSQCINQLRAMLDDPSEVKMIQSKNPYEYEQAMNYLKQMEIEVMNISDTDSIQGDLCRKRVQKHKKEFDSIRKEMRTIQQAHDRKVISETSTQDQELADLEYRANNQLFRQKQQLEDAKQTGYACEDMANDIKVNLRGQTDQLQNKTLKGLYDIQEQSTISGKLLTSIRRQREKNKYVLWAVYGILALLGIYVLYQTFGFLIPSLPVSESSTETEASNEVEGA